MSDIVFAQAGGRASITLNRPKVLNALSLPMIEQLHTQLQHWEQDADIAMVDIIGAGDRAFCVGGDIRALHEWGQHDVEKMHEFYRKEYRLNHYIKHYSKPYVALLNGATMGAGAGLSMHGSHRIATERFVFAMPETGIGLFPDVGGSYFLSRLPHHFGVWLALTGARISAADACYLGLATHYLDGASFAQWQKDAANGAQLEALLGLATAAPPSDLADKAEIISKCFGQPDLLAVCAALEDAGAWGRKTLDTIATKSPVSSLVAFRQLRTGAMYDFTQCMQMEFRIVLRIMAQKDFYEGVRAVIIDKDNTPQWTHKTIGAVSENLIEDIFAPLGEMELRVSSGA